jgi:P4 family phage/plasmid primase-like protien
MLPGHWKQGRAAKLPANSLLSRLLGGVFKGDPDSSEKAQLLAEICGVAALGHAVKMVQPRAVILYGPSAENGKGQIVDLMRGLLPESATCCVAPAIMSDERHVIALAGKLLNATDELSAAAIASDRFKSIITGDPVFGRDVYKSRIEFRPIGQHAFGANKLPPFSGGMDRGVIRRLCVIPFNRVIPVEERIEGIGQLVAQREPDLLLGWAVQGASRVLRNGVFTIPSSCRQALREWIFAADPILAWVDECVQVDSGSAVQSAIKTRAAYNEFRTWAAAEGFKSLPDINGFVQRVMSAASGIEHRRSGTAGRRFIGMRILPAEKR